MLANTAQAGVLVNLFRPGGHLKRQVIQENIVLPSSKVDLAYAVFHAEGEASDGEAAPNSFPQNSNPLPPNVVV